MTVIEFKNRAKYQNGYDRELDSWKIIDIHQIPTEFEENSEFDFYCSNGKSLVRRKTIKMKLQALRLQSGWKVNWNLFYEQDINEENCDYEFSSSTLFSISNTQINRCIELIWHPKGELNGKYILEVFNLTEKYNTKKKIVEKVPESLEPVITFESKNRQEIVNKIEALVLELKPYDFKKEIDWNEIQ